MSLIHDALKSMDSPRESAPIVGPARVSAQPRRPGWLDALLAFLTVLAAGVLGWFIWQHQMRPTPDLNPVVLATPSVVNVEPKASPALVAPVESPQVTAIAQAAAEPPVQGVPTAQPSGVSGAGFMQAPSLLAPVQTLPRVTTPKWAPTEMRAAPALAAPHTPIARPVRYNKPGQPGVSEVVAAPAVDETPIEQRFAHFVAAMKDGRINDAEMELVALKGRLPAGSPGLLRAQAWFDLRAGRDAAAAEGYRAILDRMPGDEEAAINLASIQARQLKTEEARATLDAAARLQPDSTALRAALAKFTPGVRQ